MATTVRDTDRGARRLIAGLEQLDRVRLTVGVHEDTGAAPHAHSGGTITEVAAAVELGTIDRAPRSFVRAAVDARSDLGGELAAAGVRVLEGADPDAAFGAVGEQLAGDMRNLAPAGTGQTRDAIESRVKVG